ncbi:CXXC motif containing zinc binding protein-like [Bolinopsis microptera]|uniref:CXXC motif containing zinc binding protein-like n=1 Tax=Bolinopsis microptera TaxID=2820187 RepID=UPI00307A7262
MFVELQLSASLVNIESFIAEGDDFRWYLKIKCSNCGEVPDHFVYVAEDETSEVKGGRGSANLVAKCKMCNRENSLSIVESSVKGYANDSVQFASIVKFECRGIEPVDFSPRTGWIATAADSGASFPDVDLGEKEWCDYDEKEDREVGIYELKWQFKTTKN